MSVRQLRDVLRADVLSGRHEPGERLPSEHELMALLGASRTAVRAALDLLRQEGLIERVPGVGTSVVSAKASHGLDRLRGLAESFGEGHGRIENEVLSASLVPAPRVVAQRLQLDPGQEVVLIERLRHLDRRPLSLDNSYLPVDIGRPLLDLDLRANDVFVLLDGPLGHRSLGRDASKRPKARAPPAARAWRVSPMRRKCRWIVRSFGAHPQLRANSSQMWAAVRSGSSRLSASARCNTSSGTFGDKARGLGLSASNPPARHARIHPSSVERPTVISIPSGCGCGRPAISRTSRPRWRVDSAGSAASRIRA